MTAVRLETGRDALALLTELGASPRLLRHHELVLEAALLLTDGLQRAFVQLSFDAALVHVGAALHDCGKISHPGELSAPGHDHEPSGRTLLLAAGVPEHLARFCLTHAAWGEPGLALEDLFVALADKLWKGKRVAELEQRVIAELAACTQLPSWRVFDVADALFESIARGGDRRLAQSLG